MTCYLTSGIFFSVLLNFNEKRTLIAFKDFLTSITIISVLDFFWESRQTWKIFFNGWKEKYRSDLNKLKKKTGYPFFNKNFFFGKEVD